MTLSAMYMKEYVIKCDIFLHSCRIILLQHHCKEIKIYCINLNLEIYIVNRKASCKIPGMNLLFPCELNEFAIAEFHLWSKKVYHRFNSCVEFRNQNSVLYFL